MSRKCTICAHKMRADIDRALVGRQTFRHISAQYGVSTSALVRHSDDHIPASLVKAKCAAEAVEADALLARVLGLLERAEGIIDAAEKDENWAATTGAIREARGCISRHPTDQDGPRWAPSIAGSRSSRAPDL